MFMHKSFIIYILGNSYIFSQCLYGEWEVHYPWAFIKYRIVHIGGVIFLCNQILYHNEAKNISQS